MEEQRGLIVKVPGRTLKDIIYNLRQSIYYLKTFFWNVWWFRGFDYSYTLILLRKALMENLKSIREGQEVETDRKVKEKQLERVITLLENILDDDYAEVCGYDHSYNFDFKTISEEPHLSELITDETEEQKKNNEEALKRAQKLEDKEWNELFRTIKNNMRSWWN